MSTSSAFWTGTKRAMLGAIVIAITLIAFVLFNHGSSKQQTVMHGLIPIPFGSNGSVLQGSITLFGQRNGINVYEVEFNHDEPFEHLGPNKIYLVHVPNGTGVSDVPLDLSLTLTGTGGHLVDYYGYRYTDAAATVERRDIAAVRFKDRFPGQFFASQTARNGDVAHGRSIASFEAANNVAFLPTDGSLGSVRLDPAGALYVFIVNVAGGADLRVRGLTGCGNHVLDSGEQCDDGNLVDTDSCKNDCTIGFPIPFDGGPTGSGISLTLTQFSASSGAALAGAASIPLVRFTAIASDLTTIKHLAFAAEAGSLTSLEHYRLWQDTDNDGVTDLPITLPIASVGNRVVFDSPLNWSGALVLSHAGTVFELKADVPAGLQGTKTIRVGFAQSETDFVGGQRNTGTFPLFGIKKNGVCTTQICQIVVMTGTSPLWTLTGASASSSSANSSTGNSASSSTSTPASSLSVTITSSPSATPIGGGGANSDASLLVSVGDSIVFHRHVESQGMEPNSLNTWKWSTQNLNCSVSADDSTLTCTVRVNGTTTVSHEVVAGFADGNTRQIESNLIYVTTDGAFCGNGVTDTGEECDDGNTVDTDDCDNSCSVSVPTPNL